MKENTIKQLDNLLNKIAGTETCTTLQTMLNELIPDNTYIFLTGETGGCTIPTITGKPGNVKLVHAPSFRKHNGHFYVTTMFDKCDKEVRPEDILPYDPYNYNAFMAILHDYKEGHYVDLNEVNG